MSTYDKITQKALAQDFLKFVHEDLLQVKQPHFDIAFRLDEAKRLNYASLLGYTSIYELAEKEFGFKRSSTKAYISVYENYMHGMELDVCWQGYGFSQLTEMLSIPVHERLLIKPILFVH